jgi:ADP-ribosyl-[dinitrogen reductase] hydrolase
MTYKDRIIGCFYGQLIGDALGARYEFISPKNINDIIQKDITSKNFLPILGGGHFNVKIGQITDDSEMANALLFSIIAKKNFHKDDVAKNYIFWFHSKPFDIGNSIYNALRDSITYENMIDNAKKYNNTSMSNGCLMRISPLALIGINMSDDCLIKYCEEDTIMTHPHPICIDAVKCYIIAIKYCILTADRFFAYNKAVSFASTDLIKQFLYDAKEKKRYPILSNGERLTDKSNLIGYIGIAFQNAFYQLLNSTNFYDAMINTLLLGGDTDTNCCIAGALVGSLFGNKSQPIRWLKTIKMNNPRANNYPYANQENIHTHIEKLADDLCDKIH